MTRLFGRRAQLFLGETLYEGLRLSFTVKRSLKPEPDTLELEVSNLSKDTRAQLQAGLRVILNAGYRDTLANIFAGNVRTIHTRWEGPELVTTFSTGDGDQAFGNATVSLALGKGAGLDQVVERMASAMGVDAAQAKERMLQPDVAGTTPYPRGYSASGKASSELTKALARAGLSWTLQDGRLIVLGPQEVLPGEAILLRADTGLVDSPEPNDKQENKGPPTTSMKSLLQPTIRPGVALKVESETVTGLFRAETVTHTGDTEGEEWYTEVEAIPLGG